jgi:hypothetical protein
MASLALHRIFKVVYLLQSDYSAVVLKAYSPGSCHKNPPITFDIVVVSGIRIEEITMG